MAPIGKMISMRDTYRDRTGECGGIFFVDVTCFMGIRIREVLMEFAYHFQA